MNNAEKARENRVRRMAKRRGLRVERCRRRDPKALGYGLYRVVCEDTGGVMYGSASWGGYSLTLSDVEEVLE